MPQSRVVQQRRAPAPLPKHPSDGLTRKPLIPQKVKRCDSADCFLTKHLEKQKEQEKEKEKQQPPWQPQPQPQRFKTHKESCELYDDWVHSVIMAIDVIHVWLAEVLQCRCEKYGSVQ